MPNTRIITHPQAPCILSNCSISSSSYSTASDTSRKPFKILQNTQFALLRSLYLTSCSYSTVSDTSQKTFKILQNTQVCPSAKLVSVSYMLPNTFLHWRHTIHFAYIVGCIYTVSPHSYFKPRSKPVRT